MRFMQIFLTAILVVLGASGSARRAGAAKCKRHRGAAMAHRLDLGI